MYGKMQEYGLAEITPFICTSVIWGQYPVFSHPEILSMHYWGGCSVGILFPTRVPSGLTVREAVMLWVDGCNILCLLTWQVIFFIHRSHSGKLTGLVEETPTRTKNGSEGWVVLNMKVFFLPKYPTEKSIIQVAPSHRTSTQLLCMNGWPRISRH